MFYQTQSSTLKRKLPRYKNIEGIVKLLLTALCVNLLSHRMHHMDCLITTLLGAQLSKNLVLSRAAGG